jgi:hypothetical protein
MRSVWTNSAHLLRWFKPWLLARLAIVQGFLHSDESAPITMNVTADPGIATPLLQLRGELQPQVRRKMARVRSKLTSVAGLTGMLPMPFAMELGRPGDGNHIGCTFPMSRSPMGLQSGCARQGRWLTAGSRGGRIRLSTIPATTITFTAMANARRIARAAFDLG